MSTRSMNATQDQTHRFGGPGGTAAISHPGRAVGLVLRGIHAPCRHAMPHTQNFLQAPPFFDYPAEIRKVIYTTNAIESVNMGLRKLSKNRGSFPSDEALTKLFYLALRNISQKWTMPIRDWKAALTRFTIQFGDRISVN